MLLITINPTYLGATIGNAFNCSQQVFGKITKSSTKRCANCRHESPFGPNCCIHVPAAHKTDAIESVIAVLINFHSTLDRPSDNVDPPKSSRKTPFRVMSGPGREKNSANTNTNWNSWNTDNELATFRGLYGFRASPSRFSTKMYSEMISKQ